MSERVRVNLSLRVEDVDLIDHCANQLGLSRASYCTVLIKRALGTVSSNYGSVSVHDEELGDLLVWKGYSADT